MVYDNPNDRAEKLPDNSECFSTYFISLAKTLLLKEKNDFSCANNVIKDSRWKTLQILQPDSFYFEEYPFFRKRERHIYQWEENDPENSFNPETSFWDEMYLNQEQIESDFQENDFCNNMSLDNFDTFNNGSNELNDEQDLQTRKREADLHFHYVMRSYAAIGRSSSFSRLENIGEIYLDLLKHGYSECLYSYIHLLNAKTNIDLMLTEKQPFNLTFANEALAFLNQLAKEKGGKEHLSNDILSEYANAFQLQAILFEQNQSYNASMAARQQEELIRLKLQEKGYPHQGAFLCNTCLAKATNYCRLGDTEAELEFLFQAEEMLEKYIDYNETLLPLKFNILYRKVLAYLRLKRIHKGIELICSIRKQEHDFILKSDENMLGVYLNHLFILQKILFQIEAFDKSLKIANEIRILLEDSLNKCSQNQLINGWLYQLMMACLYRNCAVVYTKQQDYHRSHTALLLGIKCLYQVWNQYGFEIRPLLTELENNENILLCQEEKWEEALQMNQGALELIDQYQQENQHRCISLYPRLLLHQVHLLSQLKRKEEVGPLLNSCVGYWHKHVIENGNLRWRGAYAITLGERGEWFMQYRHDYKSALSDCLHSVNLFDDLLDDEELYVFLPLYIFSLLNLARTLILNNRDDDALSILTDRFQRWTQLYLDKKIFRYFLNYHYLFGKTANIAYSLKGVDTALQFIDSTLTQCHVMQLNFEDDGQYDQYKVGETLEDLSIRIQLTRLTYISMNESIDLHLSQMKNLFLEMAKLLLKGNMTFVLNCQELLGEIDKLNHGMAIDLLQNLLYEIRESTRLESLTFHRELLSLFSTFTILTGKLEQDKNYLLLGFDYVDDYVMIGRKQTNLENRIHSGIHFINNSMRKIRYYMGEQDQEKAGREVHLLHTFIVTTSKMDSI